MIKKMCSNTYFSLEQKFSHLELAYHCFLRDLDGFTAAVRDCMVYFYDIHLLDTGSYLPPNAVIRKLSS